MSVLRQWQQLHGPSAASTPAAVVMSRTLTVIVFERIMFASAPLLLERIPGRPRRPPVVRRLLNGRARSVSRSDGGRSDGARSPRAAASALERWDPASDAR